MGSRIFWILMVAVALIAGAATQNATLFGWGEDHRSERAMERAVEARAERSVETRVAGEQVLRSEGRTIKIDAQTRRELGSAVRSLVSAETNLALTRVRNRDDAAVREARSRRNAAFADVERVKAQIERQENLSPADRDLMRQQIQQDVRTSIRETIRSAVRG